MFIANLESTEVNINKLEHKKKPLFAVAVFILGMPKFVKRIVAMSVDMCLCLLALWLAYYLRLGEFVSLTGSAMLAISASLGVALPIFIMFGLYRAIFRYGGWIAMFAVGKAVSMYGLIYATIFTAIGVMGVPRTVGIIQPILLLLLVGGVRALVQVVLGNQYLSILKLASRPKVLIYGAGQTGRQLVAAISNSHEIQVAGFLDDDKSLHDRMLNGQPIYNPSDLANLTSKLKITHVLLAMPNINRMRRNEILDQFRTTRVAVRTIPRVTDLAQGKLSISDLHELDIDDLLGREPVVPNSLLLEQNIRGKVVMVTGAGGSIGSEICRQILLVGPSKLLLIENSEFALFKIHQELLKYFDERDPPLFPLLASVQDVERISEIIKTWHPHTIYHAAAYKHVPLVEHNPSEGVKNNVFGTLCIAKVANENNVPVFVLISTDKAVRPTNIMGASKRLAEMILQAIAATNTTTKFSMVRFGNVLGSSGSVVPKFRQQIRDGGPITLTHPDVTRFFMTIQEASQLVIQASAMASGGEVFVLDMGQPVKILSLAMRMIELSGLTLKDDQNPKGDIKVEITGLRPGEKLYEELLIGGKIEHTSHLQIMKAHEEFIPWFNLDCELKELDMALRVNDVRAIKLIIEKLVIGYTPNKEIVDWIYLEQHDQNITSNTK